METDLEFGIRDNSQKQNCYNGRISVFLGKTTDENGQLSYKSLKVCKEEFLQQNFTSTGPRLLIRYASGKRIGSVHSGPVGFLLRLANEIRESCSEHLLKSYQCSKVYEMLWYWVDRRISAYNSG